MPLISENIALTFFAALLILAALLAWWMGPHPEYDRGRFHTFIAILAGLGIFITFLFYYNVIQLQSQQQKLAAAQELSHINDIVLNSVLNEIQEASSIIPNFVLSITPLTNNVCCFTGTTGITGITGITGFTGCSIPVGTDPINPETCTEKMVLSYRIFSLWQDAIMLHKFINMDALAYISNFLQRSNSSQLFAQWTAAKINFDSATQSFGDLLFEYGLPITVQTPQEYVSVAQELISDPRYQAIFK